MISRALVVGAFIAIFHSSSAMADDCKLVRLASLDFSDRGSILISVSVQGREVPMVVDTGSPTSIIDPVVAKNLDIPEQRISRGNFYNLAGETFTYLARPRDFGLGDMHSNQGAFLVWPSPMSADGHVGGLIAADILHHYDADIDFGSRKFNLFSQDHCPGKVVYWTSENVAVVPVHVNNAGHIIVHVILDDHPFDAVLDTGSSATLLTQKAAQRSFGLGSASPEMIKVSDHGGPGGVPLYRHAFKTLSLEGIAIGNTPIMIFEDQVQSQETLEHHTGSRFASVAGEEYELTLGLNELRHFHLYIAYKEQKLYITPASQGAAARAPASGVPAVPSSTTTASPAH